MHLYMFLSLSFLSSLPPRDRPLLAGNSIGESCEIKQFIEPPACGVYTADVILQTINKGKQRKTSKIINIQSSPLLSQNLRGGPHKLGNKLFHINKKNLFTVLNYFKHLKTLDNPAMWYHVICFPVITQS